MRTLHLLRSNGTAALEGEQLVVRTDDQEFDRAPLPRLEQILVMGQLQLTTPLIRACLGRGIPIAACLGRGIPIAYLKSQGQCLGRLQPVTGGSRARRSAELTDLQRLVVARALVAGKIGNGRGLLHHLTRDGGREALEQPLRRLGQLQGLAKQTPCLNQLRGLEGAAMAAYFRLLGNLLEGDGFGFTVRQRRPPLTAFDALCGFGDGVLRLIRAGHLRPAKHFEPHGTGTRLNEEGRALWLQRWTTFMAEPIALADGRRGPRWEVVDRLVQSFARFLEDPEQPLWIPSVRTTTTAPGAGAGA
ncbi:MAG: CRISPR-associated endonuclease Cas1 [Cyanobacteriota bacterium]|nr:CRISPR-associated endonuclease Cas1 [Cyanobacteriota bacterium]